MQAVGLSLRLVIQLMIARKVCLVVVDANALPNAEKAQKNARVQANANANANIAENINYSIFF